MYSIGNPQKDSAIETPFKMANSQINALTTELIEMHMQSFFRLDIIIRKSLH